MFLLRYLSRKLRLIGAFAVIIAFAHSFQSANAQVLYGSLVGNITDTTGAAIPGAKVMATNPSTGMALTGAANDAGAYTISDVPAGTYKVTIASPSFGTIVLNNVEVQNNQTRRADAVMNAAQVNQTVSVEADAAVLQADRTDVNAELSAQQIEDLPTSTTRNFQSLFRTVPGASPPAASHAGASNPQLSVTYNINGGTNTSNTTYIDGANDEYPWLPEIAAYVPPQDAISAVNLVTNSFDAEIGFGASSSTNVTLKTGNNQLHGAAWEYNTVSALKAKNYFFIGARNPKYIFNQFGADLGGPIWKNKLFFFGDWERTTQRNLLTGFATVPTAAEIAGNFNGTGTTVYDPGTGTATGTGRTAFLNNSIPTGRMSTAAMKMLALLPAPNVVGATISNNYFASGDYALTRQNADIKISYLPGGKTTFFGSYSISPSNIFDGQELGAAGGPTVDGGQPGNALGRVQRIVLGGTHSFTPSLLIDGNFAFTRLNYQAVNTDIGSAFGVTTLGIPGTNSGAAAGDTLDNGIPDFTLSGFTSLGNTNSSNPFHFRDNMWVEAANATWVHYSHSIRWGGAVFHYQIADFQANPTYGVRGGFTFSGGLTVPGSGSPTQFNSLADFELGLPVTMGEDHQNTDPSVVRQNVFGFYVQDHWQANKNLTVTYGLRYELYPYSSSDHYGGVRYDPTNNNVYIGGLGNVPSNAGVNTGHGLLAPRAGIAYRLGEKTVIRGGYGFNPNSEFFRYNVQVYPAVISAQYSGANSYAAAGDLRTGIPTFVPPSLSTGTVALPSSFGTYTYAANYRRGYAENGNLFIERDLGAGFLFDIGYVHSHGVRIDSELNINAAAPGTGKAGQPLFAAYGNASSIYNIIPFLSSDYNALQTQVKRSVGRRGSIGANYTWSKAMDSADSGSESGLTFNAPGYLGRNYALAGFDRKHNFEVFGSYQSPFGRGQHWLTHGVAGYIAGGWQINSVVSRTSGTPFSVSASTSTLNAPGNSQLANQVKPHVAILGGHGAGNPYFDTTAFAAVTAAGVFGNSARDTLRGPGYFDMDASVFRDFPIGDRVTFQFRTEAFNVTNTPQFSAPAANVSNSGFGIISSSSGERQLRFAGKITF